MMKKSIFIFSIMGLILSSCSSTRYFNIDVYEPANISLPPEIAYVSVVDNTLLYSLEEHRAAIGNDNSLLIPADSAKRTFLKTLVQNLNDQKYFQEVNLYPYQIRTDNDYYKEKPLLFSEIRSITKEAEADAIIALDDFMIGGIAYERYEPYMDRSHVFLGLNLTATIKIYAVNGDQFSEPIVLNDTIYQDVALDGFIPMEWLNFECDWVAKNSVQTLLKQIAPFWDTQERMYFSNVKNATSYISNSKWQEAVTFWEEEYKKVEAEDKKMRIAFNLALVNECLDQIDTACDWIEKSRNLMYVESSERIRKDILLYQKTLEKRKVSRAKLETQIGSLDGVDAGDL